jgi:hypothetical protein
VLVSISFSSEISSKNVMKFGVFIFLNDNKRAQWDSATKQLIEFHQTRRSQDMIVDKRANARDRIAFRKIDRSSRNRRSR